MPICPVCGNDYERTLCEFCMREKRWTVQPTLNKFPPRVRESLEDIEISTSAKHLDLIQKGDGVFFTGPAGTGKTTMAANLVLETMHERYIHRVGPKDFEFYTATQILFELRQCYDCPTKNEKELIDLLCDVDLLVIDDLGVEKSSDWVLQVFHMIIDHRYSYKKATIITSNKTLDELSDKWEDDRIVSRICGMCDICTLSGTDKRSLI